MVLALTGDIRPLPAFVTTTSTCTIVSTQLRTCRTFINCGKCQFNMLCWRIYFKNNELLSQLSTQAAFVTESLISVLTGNRSIWIFQDSSERHLTKLIRIRAAIIETYLLQRFLDLIK